MALSRRLRRALRRLAVLPERLSPAPDFFVVAGVDPCNFRKREWRRILQRAGIGQRKINLSRVFAGQIVGIREADDQIWLVSFLDFDLGFFDREEARVEPAPNPFGPEKVLTMSPG